MEMGTQSFANAVTWEDINTSQYRVFSRPKTDAVLVAMDLVESFNSFRRGTNVEHESGGYESTAIVSFFWGVHRIPYTGGFKEIYNPKKYNRAKRAEPAPIEYGAGGEFQRVFLDQNESKGRAYMYEGPEHKLQRGMEAIGAWPYFRAFCDFFGLWMSNDRVRVSDVQWFLQHLAERKQVAFNTIGDPFTEGYSPHKEPEFAPPATTTVGNLVSALRAAEEVGGEDEVAEPDFKAEAEDRIFNPANDAAIEDRASYMKMFLAGEIGIQSVRNMFPRHPAAQETETTYPSLSMHRK